MRADMVLTEAQPAGRYGGLPRQPMVLMAHGYWLDRPTLDAALGRLAAIYADDRGAPPMTRANATALVARLRKAQAAGFVFSDSEFAILAAALRKAGLADVAARVEGLEITPEDRPAAVAFPLED